MCGIYGIISLSPDPWSLNEARELLLGMGQTVLHRGPDDHGEFIGAGVGFGMRRLSIIDLAGGHQPISNEDETVWVVCNGEIYNFKELRSDLIKRGHRFRTQSDTEVLVHLYEDYGVEAFHHLNGMFGAAIWDKTRQRAILVRDRLGKKPLYIWKGPTQVVFGSEVKAILKDRSIHRRLNLAAVEEFITWGFVPGPLTLFEGIEKILPGHYVVIENGRVEQQPYWRLEITNGLQLNKTEWVEKIRASLEDAVCLRLMSDVPLGAFLSGGVDSSSIVALMAKHSDQRVKTYSIGFEGEDEFYNELKYAKLIAETFGTDHHEIIVKPQMAELLPKLVWHMDEPIADSAQMTTFLVAELASQSVKVILSGVGGDEIFAGYRRYLSEAIGRWLRFLPGVVSQGMIPAVLRRLPKDRHAYWSNLFRLGDGFMAGVNKPFPSRYFSYLNVFNPEISEILLVKRTEATTKQEDGFQSAVLANIIHQVRHLEPLNQAMVIDLHTSLPDDLLLLTDKMTMACSVECRAPFLDYRLVEMAANIPPRLKLERFKLKSLLKEVVRPWIPNEILQRSKRGFWRADRGMATQRSADIDRGVFVKRTGHSEGNIRMEGNRAHHRSAPKSGERPHGWIIGALKF
jgi:asparagine synthase (glutamine-hydrolysing)